MWYAGTEIAETPVEPLARRILAVVIVFVLAVAGILVARSRTLQTETAGPSPSTADLSIKEVQLQEESVGGSRWQLTADHAAVFDELGRTTLRRVRVRVQDRDRTWTIVGEEGDFYRQTQNLEIRRNVVVTSGDGFRLETTVLRWLGAERRLWTDAPVRISRHGLVVDGSALDVLTGEEATTVTGRVRAVFTRGPEQ